MMKKNIFVVFSSLLMGFQILELVSRLFHTSICSSKGCRLAEESVKYGDWILLTIGILIVFLLIVLAFFEKKDSLTTIFINSILILALAAEGFLVGFQVFQLQQLCSFCLTVFCGFVFLALIRFFAGYREILTGFVCCICVFVAVSLVQFPVSCKCMFPEDKKLILFYSPGCSHCEKIIRECERCKIEVYKIPAKKYLDFLQELGIKEVPVLVVNKKNKKKFLIGESEIKKYIYSLINNKSFSFHNNQYFQHLEPFPFQKSPETEEGSCQIGKGCNGL